VARLKLPLNRAGPTAGGRACCLPLTALSANLRNRARGKPNANGPDAEPERYGQAVLSKHAHGPVTEAVQILLLG
jgi:hypothetical protein